MICRQFFWLILAARAEEHRPQHAGARVWLL